MKFVTFKHHAGLRLGVVDGDNVIDLATAEPGAPSDLRAALEQGVDVRALARKALANATAVGIPLAQVVLAPVVPRPGKIVCLGHNYYDHAKEGGNLKPVYPLIFFRGATSLIAHGDSVVRPFVSEKLDYEAELAVIIGKGGRHIKREQALDHVFGYACFNDVSVRDYQKRTAQWTIGKNFDGTGAFGPTIVTPEDLPAGAAGLKMQLRLNGEVMQNADTSDMIWSVAETIELVTECLTLEPGDVIAMGTPAGVGFARTPPVWMKDGDLVEVDIEQIGVLRNVVRDEVRAE